MRRLPTSPPLAYDPFEAAPPGVMEQRRDMERLLAETEPASDAEALAALRRWFPARTLTERVRAVEAWRLTRVG